MAQLSVLTNSSKTQVHHKVRCILASCSAFNSSIRLSFWIHIQLLLYYALFSFHHKWQPFWTCHTIMKQIKMHVVFQSNWCYSYVYITRTKPLVLQIHNFSVTLYTVFKAIKYSLWWALAISYKKMTSGNRSVQWLTSYSFIPYRQLYK